MSNVSQELQHQIEVLRAQRIVEINGPISQVNNFIQALSRIYEIAADVAEMERKLDEIETIAKECANNLNSDYLTFSVGCILGVISRKPGENNERNQEIECMIGILRAMNDKNARAVVVEEWIQKNGPLPLKYGEEVRQILMDGQEE
jgi:tRNA(Ser,Leu) C12 N-acetylase TAN1